MHNTVFVLSTREMAIINYLVYEAFLVLSTTYIYPSAIINFILACTEQNISELTVYC